MIFSILAHSGLLGQSFLGSGPKGVYDQCTMTQISPAKENSHTQHLTTQQPPHEAQTTLTSTVVSFCLSEVGLIHLILHFSEPLTTQILQDNVTYANLRRSSEWIPSPLFTSSSSSSFILDIDEDFFGTESPAELLSRESGLEWKQIQRISKIVSELFCPTTVEAETASDQLVGAI